MKGMATVTTLVLLMVLSPVWVGATELGELRLSMISGEVQIKTIDTGEWAPAVINLPLKDGDQLWVPSQGRAEVESRRGSILRLDERSLLEVLRVDKDAQQFYLSMGRCYVNAKGERETTLQLETPVSSLRAYERAKFSVEVARQGSTDLLVFLGGITVENNRGVTTVDGGNMLSLDENFADLSPLSLADSWEQWNKDQDRNVEESRESVRYLPEELVGYSRDFDDNGEWVEVPAYGTVWRPTVHVTLDWSPYRHGRWLWIGDDYVWVAREPWGWAPYHYGRWSYVGRHGWCWVPPERHQVYWGPGYVGWVTTTNSVSWVPLAPREIYYGHGHYGKYSKDIGQGRGPKVRGDRVYHNIHIHHAVTTIHHETFLRGRQVAVEVKGNPFLNQGEIRAGRPEIKPIRATKVAVIREIPQSEAPPAAVREINVDELKGRRRLVKREGRSAFAPDKTPAAMPLAVRREPHSRGPRPGKREGASAQEVMPTTPEKATPPVAERGQGGRGAPSALPAVDQGGAPPVRTPSATGSRPAAAGQGAFGVKRQQFAPTPRAEGERSSPSGGVLPPAREIGNERWQRPGSEALPTGQDQGARQRHRLPLKPPAGVGEDAPVPEDNVALPVEPPPAESTGRGRWRRPENNSLPSSQDQGERALDRQPPAPSTAGRGSGVPPAERVVPAESSPLEHTREGVGPRSGSEAILPGQQVMGRQREQHLLRPPSPSAETVPAPVNRGVVAPAPPLPLPEKRGIFRQSPPTVEGGPPAASEGAAPGAAGRGRPVFQRQVAPPPREEAGGERVDGQRRRQPFASEVPAAEQPPLGRGLRGRNRQEMAPAVGRMQRVTPPGAANQQGEGEVSSPAGVDEQRTIDNTDHVPETPRP